MGEKEGTRGLQLRLIEAITRAQANFITGVDFREVSESLLSDILDLTESEYGFIGEVLYTTEGKPFLKVHAITNISWDEKTRTFYEQKAPGGMEFFNLKTLFGEVITTGEPVISNDPAADPRRGGTPEGHPTLRAFLGLPIEVGKRLVGVAGVANRPGGYDLKIVHFLQPLLNTIGQLIEAKRSSIERTKIEGDLRRALAELSAIHQNAPILMLVVDPERRVRKVNGAVSLFTGLGEEEMIDRREGEALRCLHHLDDPQGCGFGPECTTCGIRLAIEETFSTGRSLRNVEVWIPYARGEEVGRACFLVNTAHLKVDPDERVLICLQDISDLKRTEAELRLSEEKAFKAFQASPAWLVISSLEEGRYLEVNEAFLRSTGFTREEVIGRSALELNIWADPGERAGLVSELKERGSVRGREVTLRRKSGEPINVLLSAEIIEIGGVKYMLSASLDITERRRQEEAPRRSEERYRTLVEGSIDAIALLDPERRILSCNQAFCQLFGYERQEVEGRSIRIVHRSDESFRSFGELAYPVIKEKGSFRGEWTFVRKDGAEIEAEVVLSTLRSPEGSIAGYVSISRDMTERKRAEQERAILQEQLRQSQKMEAIGRLAGGIAHDFNNILTVIKGSCQLSLLGLHEKDPLYVHLKEIEQSADRAADLIRQLLAFSRKQVLEPRVLDLNGIVKNLEKMLRRILGEDIELVTFLGEEIGRVKVDPGQMEQAIINLAVNARDAMPKGGKLTIETADIELDEDYAKRHVGVIPGAYVMLSISDTGIGMTPEIQERIFEPFFTTKERGKGTGLGLSTVYGIVKQSGGNIWVYSEPGRGTTFKIYLPRVEGPLEERREEASSEVSRGSETILVIEDEEIVRKLAVRLLKRQGYNVLEAPDGGKAFMLCESYREPIHLILSDVVMPGVSGRELVERLQ
ncbi:MAG: PAS domain S-box protein, partial [Desulfobacterota bacterium]|nr:PAS domain S-box protein [Thermodesulfobacteriota bacterium]